MESPEACTPESSSAQGSRQGPTCLRGWAALLVQNVRSAGCTREGPFWTAYVSLAGLWGQLNRVRDNTSASDNTDGLVTTPAYQPHLTHYCVFNTCSGSCVIISKYKLQDSICTFLCNTKILTEKRSILCFLSNQSTPSMLQVLLALFLSDFDFIMYVFFWRQKLRMWAITWTLRSQGLKKNYHFCKTHNKIHDLKTGQKVIQKLKKISGQQMEPVHLISSY